MHGINSEQNRAMRRWLRETYHGACAYCQRQIGKRGTVDHYLPKALGGGNGKHNLRWCCIACNQAKADMHPAEWECYPRRPAPRQPTRAEVRQHLLQLASPIGKVRALGQATTPSPKSNPTKDRTMATIENEGRVSPEKFRAEIGGMPDEVLLAQDLVQQGALHALSWLLTNGCTEENAVGMLASLRENSRLIRLEAVRRGKPSLFERDQVAFN